MSTSILKGQRFRIVFSIALFVMLAFVLFLVFPKEPHFSFDFKKGSPWMHEDLIAPFDFTIQKTDEEIKQERDSIKARFYPLYVVDTSVAGYVKIKYINYLDSIIDVSGFDKQPHGKSAGLLFGYVGQGRFSEITAGKIASTVDNIYNRGVADVSLSWHQMRSEKITVVESGYSKGVVSITEISHPDSAFYFFSETIKQFAANSFSQSDSIEMFIIYTLCDINFFKPNLIYDSKTSLQLLNQQYQSIATQQGLIQQGELIVQRGMIVDENTYRILVSLKNEYWQKSSGVNYTWVSVGYALLIILLLLVYYLHLYFNFKPVLFQIKQIGFIVMQMMLMILLTHFVVQVWQISIFLIPYVIFPVLVYIFFNNRIALVSYWILILMVSFFAPDSYSFIFVQIVAGMIVLFTLRSVQRRFHLFLSVLWVLISYVFSFSGFHLIREGNFADLSIGNFVWFGGNAFLLLTLFPMLYIYERVFGFLSDVSLLELSDTNNAALKELSEKAPGTFQHSMQVANLAESVVRKIGGNALLARTGALYHDIGKAGIPQYFIENQYGVNIHNSMAFDQSATIIISHVKRGEEMARKYRLPKPIVEFISTHHGTTVTRYFYNCWANQHPDEEINNDLFTYPGPKPTAIEAAVVMMADAVEASSRSLKTYDPETVKALVHRIVDTQVAEGQFENVNITFKNITIAKEIFIEKLMNIYHSRIEYPELNSKNPQ